MKTAMRFEGGDELSRNLRALKGRVSRRIVLEALEFAAEPIRKRAAQLAPRAPGAPDLADHIGISRARGEDGAASVAIGPTRGFFYGVFQEFGTSRHGAQPFMRPAFDTEAQESLQRLKQELWRALAGRGVSRTSGSLSTSGGLT